MCGVDMVDGVAQSAGPRKTLGFADFAVRCRPLGGRCSSRFFQRGVWLLGGQFPEDVRAAAACWHPTMEIARRGVPQANSQQQC